MRERVQGSDRARLNPSQPRLNRISNGLVPLLEALKRRQNRQIVTWGHPGSLLETLETMNVSRLVDWGALWDLQELPKRLQGASWEPLEASSGASWDSFDRLLLP